MATTAKGTPYVVSTDLVANYPTVSSDLADHIDDNLAYNAVSINAQTGTTYTFALADASEGKLVTASNAAASTYTVPPQSSVTWANGAVLRILNQGAGVVTIAAGSGVTINGTPLTLAQYKGAAIQRTASNTWTFIPFSGGVGNAVISSPAKTGSYTSGGFSYDYWLLTSSTSITVGTAGFADVLVVGGGGGGGGGAGGGGGGGQFLALPAVYLDGTLTVTVGAGGAGGGNSIAAVGANGNLSRLGSYSSIGGGYGANGVNNAYLATGGGNGGGGSGTAITAGTALALSGFAGGAGANLVSGGGGGASAVGVAGVATTSSGAGGAGATNDYETGSNKTYAGGGGGGTSYTPGAGGTGGGGAGSTGAGTAGTANTGGGGGGSGLATSGAAGGSGVVIVRVKV